MRVLITGAAGFIGSHVAEIFMHNGHDVLVIDDLSNGKIENIPEGVSFEKVDIRDRQSVIDIFKKFSPEVVDHHAAQTSVNFSITHVSEDAERNILSTINLLEASISFGVRKFIFASTGGAIYGNPESIPVTEDTFPNPLSPYAISKFSVENYIKFYKREKNLSYTILRYANVYGPRQDPFGEAGVIAIFSNKIKNHEECIVFGDGNQTRDFVYVKDVARANIIAVSLPDGIYNIGTGIETSVNDIINSLREVTNGDFEVKNAEPRAGEVSRIALDYTKIKTAGGWKPEVDFKEGLKNTFLWFMRYV